MILPIEERQGRRCEECIFWNENDGWGPSCPISDNYKERVNLYMKKKDRRKTRNPCLKNFTPDEMNELLDRYNLIEDYRPIPRDPNATIQNRE